jgi:hypothetical protein
MIDPAISIPGARHTIMNGLARVLPHFGGGHGSNEKRFLRKSYLAE